MRKFNLSLLVLISVIVFSGCTFELHVPQYPYYIEDLTYEDQSTFQLITDFEQLINETTTRIMKSNVTVVNQSFKKFLSIELSRSSYFGSGVIFAESEHYYYILTNEHVAAPESESDGSAYIIYDYLNNEYQAYIYEESISKEHDLAVLYIEKTDIELEVITFNFRKPQIGHKVIAIGQPNGQPNAITFGEVMGYDAIEVYDRYDELYQHEFEAMVHTALTATGSSGGMLLDYNLLVIGIHFAGNSLPNDVFEYGYAIPTETVIEYLNLFVFKTNEPIA